MRTLHACQPLCLNRIHYLTQRQLVAANNESIRLGFSRNLIEKKVARLPPISSSRSFRLGTTLPVRGRRTSGLN